MVPAVTINPHLNLIRAKFLASASIWRHFKRTYQVCSMLAPPAYPYG